MKSPTEHAGEGAAKQGKKRNSTSTKKAPEVPPGLEHFHSKYPKPTYSYSSLITTAITESAQKQMTLNEIYEWVMERYPWYRTAINGWKVRTTERIVGVIGREWKREKKRGRYVGIWLGGKRRPRGQKGQSTMQPPLPTYSLRQ
jgi:hypothetical protein